MVFGELLRLHCKRMASQRSSERRITMEDQQVRHMQTDDTFSLLIILLRYLVLSLSLPLSRVAHPPAHPPTSPLTMANSPTSSLPLRPKRARSPESEDPTKATSTPNLAAGESAVAGANAPMQDTALPTRERKVLEVCQSHPHCMHPSIL